MYILLLVIVSIRGEENITARGNGGAQKWITDRIAKVLFIMFASLLRWMKEQEKGHTLESIY